MGQVGPGWVPERLEVGFREKSLIADGKAPNLREAKLSKKEIATIMITDASDQLRRPQHEQSLLCILTQLLPLTLAVEPQEIPHVTHLERMSLLLHTVLDSAPLSSPFLMLRFRQGASEVLDRLLAPDHSALRCCSVHRQ